MKQFSLLDRPVWVLMCRVRSEGFLKLLGQTAHWLTNLFFSRTISSRVFICDTRSFSAMLFRRTFSDKVLEDSGRRGFVSFSDDEMSKDLPFSVRFLHYDTANVRFVLVDQVQAHNNNTYNVKSCQKYWWFNHCKQLSGHRYNVYDLITRKLNKTSLGLLLINHATCFLKPRLYLVDELAANAGLTIRQNQIWNHTSPNCTRTIWKAMRKFFKSSSWWWFGGTWLSHKGQ